MRKNCINGKIRAQTRSLDIGGQIISRRKPYYPGVIDIRVQRMAADLSEQNEPYTGVCTGSTARASPGPPWEEVASAPMKPCTPTHTLGPQIQPLVTFTLLAIEHAYPCILHHSHIKSLYTINTSIKESIDCVQGPSAFQKWQSLPAITKWNPRYPSWQVWGWMCDGLNGVIVHFCVGELPSAHPSFHLWAPPLFSLNFFFILLFLSIPTSSFNCLSSCFSLVLPGPGEAGEVGR